MIIYEGPSMLDGAPIVVLTTGEDKPTTNDKTGDMLQTWVLRADVGPDEARRDGCDVSVCGDCKLRSNGCYVVVHQAPLSTWKRHKRGGHEQADPVDVGRGRRIRIGSYGDPAAVPVEVWEQLVSEADGWTGYTHQWGKHNLVSDTGERLKLLVMASVDTPDEAIIAQSFGWRTFRTRLDTEATRKGEINCPASAEMGHQVTCSQCKACCGNSFKGKTIGVVIDVHGFQAGKYNKMRAA